MIVFLHIPKTAGSTFNFILENSFAICACQTNHTKKKIFTQPDFEFARKVFPCLKCLTGHNLIDPLQLSVPDPFHITFLRDPIARVISQYRDSTNLGHNTRSFEESMKSLPDYENLHVKLMAGESNLDKAKRYLEACSFVGFTEKFDLSLHMLKKLTPYKLNLKYVRRRVTPANAPKVALEKDDRMMEIARDFNRLDLELYSFARKEIFPKFCAKTGYKEEDKVESFEYYKSESRPKFLAFSAYNMLLYRQLCKLRK
jgi:Sulfotransferase family.